LSDDPTRVEGRDPAPDETVAFGASSADGNDAGSAPSPSPDAAPGPPSGPAPPPGFTGATSPPGHNAPADVGPWTGYAPAPGYAPFSGPYPPAYAPVAYPPGAYDPRKSKMAAGLFGILLGAFGVHNFYLGYNGKAVAQLLITLLSCFMLSFVSSIWGIIEGVQILTGSINTDAAGVPLKE